MTSVSTQPVEPIRLRPRRGWSALNLREIWEFRDLLIVLGGRDIKLRYKQTALGISWVLLQPLLASGIFTLVFGLALGQAKRTAEMGLPFFVFAFANQMAWYAFNSAFTKTSTSLVGNAHLVSKVYFPRLILPLSTMSSTLLDFAISVPILAALMAIYHVVPSAAILLAPLWLLLLLLLAVGAGLAAAALTVSYRDVQYLLPVVMP